LNTWKVDVISSHTGIHDIKILIDSSGGIVLVNRLENGRSFVDMFFRSGYADKIRLGILSIGTYEGRNWIR
jgi:hypothetical protein